MESKGYKARDRSLVSILAGLTYGILNQVAAPHERATAAKPQRSWFDRLDTWFWRQELKSREAFLAQSADIVELEQRMRWLERGRC